MSSSSPPPPPPPPTIAPLWRQNPTASGSTKRQADHRRWWIFALLTCILALAGTLLGLLGWIRPLPHPYLAPLWVSNYQSRQIAILPWAEQDLHALLRGGYISRVLSTPFGSQDRRTITQELARLGRLLPADSVVVYVNARACVGPRGEVALFPADADPADLRTWIPLRELLGALRDSPAGWKLLVLDLTKPQTEQRPVLLDDDVASRVPEDLKAVADPRRLTLTAAAPGQFSLTSEELGRSIFSYYFEEALRGWTELDRPRLRRDGLVRVTDLAEYVRGRVDRWARLNRGVRQQPVLYGDGADFPLLALKHDMLQPAPPTPPPADYPGWLEAGWMERDRWKAASNDQLAPLAFRQMEQMLLAAEAGWRGGFDPARIQQDRMADLPIYQKVLDSVRATIRPKPTSLAMAVAQGWTQDPAVSAAVTELFAKHRAPATPEATEPGPAKPAAAKPEPAKPAPATATATATATAPATAKPQSPDSAGALVEKLRAASMLDVAGAFFEVAGDTEPTRETLLFLDGLLRDQQPEPLFVETLFLRQLADLARVSQDGDWPTETVRRALKVASQGEQANCRSETLAWLRQPLEDAARLRHDAEVILRARGFAAIEEADRLLRVAEARYAEILEQQRVILEARRLWLGALHFLPPSLDDMRSPTIGQDQWQETAGKVIAVREALDLPDEVTSGRSLLPTDEVRPRIEVLHARTEELRQGLDGIRRPFSDASLAALVAEARTPRAGPETVRAIHRVLRNPTPSAKQRVALWRASRDLAQRLLKETLRLDRSPLASDTTPAAEPDISRQSHARLVADRARRRISLLRVAGLPESEARLLDDQVSRALTPGNDPDAWWNLELQLRKAWDGGAIGLAQHQVDAVIRNRLIPLVAPSWSLTYTDAIPTSWFFRKWLSEHRTFWAWLADHYEYEFADLGGAPFFRTAARELRALSGTTDRVPLVSPWGSPGPVAKLTAEAPATTASLTLSLATVRGTADVTPTALDILLADPSWLRVGPASTALRRSGQAGSGAADPLGQSYDLTPSTSSHREIPLRVELDPEAEQSDTPPPQGFLVRVREGGRDYHQPVTLDLQLESRRIQILLSADPKVPTDPQADLGLRAIKDRQPYYLYLRNPTSEPQEVLVDLKVGDQSVAGAPPQLTVAAGAIGRVQFAPATLKPDAPLPELTGPLRIFIRDAADKKSLLGQAFVGVRVAAPAEYVRVTQVEYSPPSNGNATDSRLSVELRANAELAGPPAVAQLVLPPEQIPGYLGMGDGTLRGVLPQDGKPLLLFVKGLRRMPGANSDGIFYVKVDAYPRGIAFRATFPPEGQPTLPVEDARPALRLRAASSTPATAAFPVRAEVDNPGPGSSLEIVLGRSQSGSLEPEEIRRFPTAQHRRIGFAPGGSDGALLFEATADDWSTTLDLTGIEGARILRARLLDADGNEVQAVSQPLLIDDSEPAGPSFVALPTQARRGSKLPVKATARATDSGIEHVRFFVGRPPAAGAALPATVATTPGSPDPDGVIWSAVITLPDLAGPTDVSAQFESGAGRTSYATATIDLTDTDPVTPGRIVGTVMEGPRRQPGLVVVLTQAPANEAKTKAAQKKEDENTEIARATTTPDGAFRFDNLPPGNYRLATKKEASLTKAEAVAAVKPGATTSVSLELFR